MLLPTVLGLLLHVTPAPNAPTVTLDPPAIAVEPEWVHPRPVAEVSGASWAR
jgi:hypothetical protein